MGVGAVAPLYAVLGVLGFSFKAILVKLAYAAHPVDPITLLAWRMFYSAPFFALMAYWAERRSDAAPIGRGDLLRLAGLGFVGYYLSSYLDFIGLQYVTASLERLILYLYPSIVVVLLAVLHRQPITRRVVLALLLCYAGIVLVFAHDLRIASESRDVLLGGALVFASAVCYAIYLVVAPPVIGRLGSLRFIAWAMLSSTVWVLAQFFATNPVSALDVPPRVHVLSLAMAIVSTVLPTWMMAEALKRIGASQSALIGALGPLFTIGFGYLLLVEPLHAIQLAGAALVLAGIWQVTQKR